MSKKTKKNDGPLTSFPAPVAPVRKTVYAAYRTEGGFSDGTYLVGLFTNAKEAAKVAGSVYDTTDAERARFVKEVTVYETAEDYREDKA